MGDTMADSLRRASVALKAVGVPAGGARLVGDARERLPRLERLSIASDGLPTAMRDDFRAELRAIRSDRELIAKFRDREKNRRALLREIVGRVDSARSRCEGIEGIDLDRRARISDYIVGATWDRGLTKKAFAFYRDVNAELASAFGLLDAALQSREIEQFDAAVWMMAPFRALCVTELRRGTLEP